MDNICYEHAPQRPAWQRAMPRKLSNDQARAIRARHGAGESLNALAKEFGVQPASISQIVRWKSYRDAL